MLKCYTLISTEWLFLFLNWDWNIKIDSGTESLELQWKIFEVYFSKTLVLGLCSDVGAQFCSQTSKASNTNEIAVFKKTLREKSGFLFCLVDMPE